MAQSYAGKYLETNYDESRVPEYILPEVLLSFSGEQIHTIKQWEESRKPEILDFFSRNIYGEVPVPSSTIEKTFRLISEDTTLLGGLCTRKDVLISFENELGKKSMPLVLFLPNRTKGRVPVILLANGGDIKQRRLRLDSPQSYGRTQNGIPLHQLMTRGVGIATVDYLAFGVDPIHPEGKVNGETLQNMCDHLPTWICRNAQ